MKEKVLISNIYVYSQGNPDANQLIKKGDTYRWQLQEYKVLDITDAVHENPMYRGCSFSHLELIEEESK